MDWMKKAEEKKTFWHITAYDNVESIKEKGLFQSEDGQQGKGLYAIEPDYDVYDSIMEFLEVDKDLEQKNMVIVEFEYSGEYYINPKDMLLYSSEGWVFIPSDIKSTNILRFV